MLVAGESLFELKTEADGFDITEHPSDERQSIGMLHFGFLYLFISVVVCVLFHCLLTLLCRLCLLVC